MSKARDLADLLDANGDVELDALDNAPSGSGKNLIINGAMQVAQRGTTITGIGSAKYTLDRFRGIASGADATVTQVSGATYPYALRITGQASTTDTYIQHRIESENCKHIAGQNVTLSVNIRGSAAKTATVTLYYPNTTDTYGGTTSIASDTFSVTTTDTRFTSTFAIPSAATTGLQIQLKIGSQGSDWVEWSALQLEVGSVATPFEHRSFGEELLACQRYYYAHASGDNDQIGIGHYYLSYYFRCGVKFNVNMRANPSIDYSSGSYYGIYSNGANNAVDSLAIDNPHNQQVVIYDASVSGNAGYGGDLRITNASGYVAFDAEL